MALSSSTVTRPSGAQRYRAITENNVAQTEVWNRLDDEQREALAVVSKVLPFRTNRYVVEELIDWSRVPDDPVYQMTFVQRGMLDDESYAAMRELVLGDAPAEAVRARANAIRRSLNPHPDGQLTHNIPTLGGERLPGLQHKYRETVLFFPGQGQTCHAFCTYCFRWAQFVDLPDLKFQAWEVDHLISYLRAHPEVTDVLVTGGDPLIMKSSVLRRYLEPLLAADLPHLRHVRIGTKALGYWPHRFVSDPDADDLLRLFDEIVASGRHLALMAHYSHPVELGPEIARRALARVRATGAEVRVQAPLIRHVNDDAAAWAELWTTAVGLGAIPYYMFVERDTGPRHYFEIPLARTLEIFRDAYSRVSGLARSARGPSMSAHPGKVRILGVSDVAGTSCFVLDMLQARDPAWVRRPFFARFDPEATWFDQLEPAFEADRRFFAEISRDVRRDDSEPPPNPVRAPAPTTVQAPLVRFERRRRQRPRSGLRVVKIGGSLIADEADLRRVAAAVVERRRAGGEVLVVGSALKGVTDQLARAAIHALASRNGHGGKLLEAMRERHVGLASALDERRDTRDAIDRIFDEIDGLTGSFRADGSMPDPLYARLLSSGERMSVLLLAAAIRAAGSEARPMSSEQAGLRAEGPARSGSCNLQGSADGFRRLRGDVGDRVVVLTGFYGLDAAGGVVLFGRGGSDDTACAVAAGLEAERLELWKDVPGFMSSDPHKVPDARVIEELSFDEVAQLGAYGSSIVHHGCLGALRGRPTRVIVASVEGAAAGHGTRLVETLARSRPRVMALADQEGVAELRLEPHPGQGARREVPRLAAHALAALGEAGIDAEPSGAGDEGVRFEVADERAEDARAVLRRLEPDLPVSLRRTPPRIGAVGDGIATDADVHERMLGCLREAGVRSDLVARPAGRSGLSCTVHADDLSAALVALHGHFFTSDGRAERMETGLLSAEGAKP
jgi:KamA family protein